MSASRVSPSRILGACPRIGRLSTRLRRHACLAEACQDPRTISDPVSESDAAPAVTDSDARKRSIAMYPLLSQLGPRRSVVIQASGDGYLPGARARALFGPDSTMSRLVVIDARNHRFSGGESGFAAALTSAVAWVSSSAAEWR